MSDCFEPGGRFNAMLGAMVTYINGAEAEKITLAEYAHYRDSEVNRRVPQGYGALIEAYAAGLDMRLELPGDPDRSFRPAPACRHAARASYPRAPRLSPRRPA